MAVTNCASCKTAKTNGAKKHCPDSHTCTWWRCRWCGAVNDPLGRAIQER